MKEDCWTFTIYCFVFILLVIFENSDGQKPATCSLPCSIGYTCFRSRHSNRGPECIAMEVYLSLVKGSNHGHSGPGIPHAHTNRHALPRQDQTHSHSFSHNDPRLSPSQVNRVAPIGQAGTQRVVVDPNTGQRFALVPLQGQSNTNFPIRNNVWNQQPTGSDVKLPDSDKHVPVANTFETQLRDPEVNLDVSPSLPQGPRPVGPLSNNRDKSVLDIINELVKSTGSQTKPVQTPPEDTQPAVQHDGHAHHSGHHSHGSERRNTPPIVREQSRGHGHQQTHGHGQNTESSSGRQLSGNTHGFHGAVTEMPNIRTTRDTHDGHTQHGRTSAILRDTQGYYFMFYPPGRDQGVRVKITKGGFCSRAAVPQSSPCRIACTSDVQCRRNFKCCPNGCGLTCLPPRAG